MLVFFESSKSEEHSPHHCAVGKMRVNSREYKGSLGGVQGALFKGLSLLGEVSADTGVKPQNSLGEPVPNRGWA